ncbi:uncharacterized protein [Battus philenor]|uniref:uncharacterized protein n=1 Tax=Battus philenor TaxID=42288 RepID=UPI0035CF257C
MIMTCMECDCYMTIDNEAQIMGKKRKAQKNLNIEDGVHKKVKNKSKVDTTNDDTTGEGEQNETNVKETTNNEISKEIAVEDESQEIPPAAPKTKKNKAFKKSNQQNCDDLDEEVKDEDIDKFCDELDEEDNKQYEDWVQLIEANLNANIRKSK